MSNPGRIIEGMLKHCRDATCTSFGKMVAIMIASEDHPTRWRERNAANAVWHTSPPGTSFVWDWCGIEYETVKEPSYEWVNHYSARYATKAEADANAYYRDWCERVEL